MSRAAAKNNKTIDIKKIARKMTKEQFIYEVCENLEGDLIEYCPTRFGLEAKYLNKNGTCDNIGKEEQCRECFLSATEDISF